MRKDPAANAAYTFGVALSAGLLTLSMSAANTVTIAPGKYLYDVLLTSGNTVLRVIEGVATVTPDITR